MRTAMIPLLLMAAFAALGACESGEDAEAARSMEAAPGTGPGSAADDPAAETGNTREAAATSASLQVSRTQEGSGGIIAVAEELTMEFDYSPPQGHCRTSDETFIARGIGIDDEASVSIEYATVIAPDTGRVVGQVLSLEIRKDGYVPWAVNSARAGSIEEATLDISPGGGVTLTVSGLASGFQKNRAPTGVRKPYRLEATCDL